MDLTKLFETQRKLDERIVREKGLEGRDMLPEKILALQVELGECANEWRGFKFWSEDREPRKWKHDDECQNCDGKGVTLDWGAMSFWECEECRGTGEVENNGNPLLEEYVDCLHFILSIGLELDDIIFGIEDMEIHFEDIKEVCIVEHFISTNWLAGCIFDNKIHYEQTLFCVLKLGELLGFTWEQIEQAYYAKNEINHERQTNGY